MASTRSSISVPTPLAEALKKRALSLDADLLRRLRKANRPTLRLVHDARLASKLLRAWWRLMPPLAGKTAVRNADRRLAAAARLLAPQRDAYVMHRVLTRLTRQSAGKEVAATFDAGARQLTSNGSPGAAPAAFPLLREQLIRAITSDSAAWRRLPQAPASDGLLLEQAADSYRRCRRRCRKAARRAGARELHAWRKWVKIHVAQLDFLQNERSRALAGRLRQFIRLGRLLGRCQDLAVLVAESIGMQIDEARVIVAGERPVAAAGPALVPMDRVLRAHHRPRLVRIAVKKKVSVGEIELFQIHSV